VAFANQCRGPQLGRNGDFEMFTDCARPTDRGDNSIGIMLKVEK